MSVPPNVWVLLGKGTGGNGQMTSLADALGWPYETKQLVYGRLARCPNLLLGASLLGLERHASSPLSPPWPDLVIAGSRRSSPIALWVKKQSGGATKLVHLMHTQAPLNWFDLVVTTPQYRLPKHVNVLHNTLPLNQFPAGLLEAAERRWRPRLAELPRPYTALLVGGNSSSYVFDAETAARLGRDAAAEAKAQGGSLLLTTSPRTPDAALEALLAAIDGPSYCYRWKPQDADNPYHAYLALADRFIVTADSASQLAEACATGRPVKLFDWPTRPDPSRGLKGLLRRWATRRARHPAPDGETTSGMARLYDRCVYLGLIKPPRDFSAFHRALEARGMVSRHDSAAATTIAAPLRDMQQTVERIGRLLESRSAIPANASLPGGTALI